ncbi:hypothetical protein GYA49_04775 [Candidatus Beckwithbacteria bacterium]|nr:hypothetical protein [Candidatus Beckwithbacteria bacterium]
MKKILIFFNLVFLIVLSAQTALAMGPVNRGTATAAANLRDRQEQFLEKKEQVQTQIQEHRESIQNKLEESQQNRQQKRIEIAEKHREQLQERFQNYITRLSQLIAKIQTRITNEVNNGKDMTEAQAKLDEAQVKLDKATATSKEAQAAFAAITSNEGQDEQIRAARELTTQTREQFKATVELIHEAIAQLKIDAGIIN